MPVLRVRGLHKSYGDVVALRGVDLDVEAGEIVALLGPNGAGKTTVVSIVAGLRTPDAGTVEVDGLDALRRSREVRRRIGLAPQELGLYPVVSVGRNLRLFGELAGLRGRRLRTRIDELAEALGMTELLDRQAGTLSGGQKRRLHTALALLHEPALLLLDEATTGADVETRAQLLDLVRRLAGDGAAILYSTHYLAEVEALGSSVAIIDQGRVIARDTVVNLLAAHATPVVELTFAGGVPELTVGGATPAEGDAGPDRLRLRTEDPARTVAEVASRVDADRLAGVEIVQPSLESVYLALTGRRYDEADREDAREESSVPAH